MLLPFGSSGPSAGEGEFEGQEKLVGLAAALGGAGAGEGAAGERREREQRDVSTGGYIGRTASTNPHYIPTTSTSSLVSSPPRPSSSASTSTSGEGAAGGTRHDAELRGPVDDALEREIELEQLRRENEELRRLLGISVEMQEGLGGVGAGEGMEGEGEQGEGRP